MKSIISAIESLQFLLASVGLPMVNPMGERPEREGKKDLSFDEAEKRNLEFNNRVSAWERAQSTLAERCVILEAK